MRCPGRFIESWLLVSAIFMVGGLLACDSRDTIGPAGFGRSTARLASGGNGKGPGGGGGDGGGPDADPVVSAVDPDSTVQGATLDVIVTGSGFEPGSSVDWLLDGTATQAIHTNSTTFLSKRQLRASITVEPDAAADFYDVLVTTPPGRRGIGSELLQVTEDVPIEVTLRDAAGDEIVSDGGGTYGTNECGDARFNLDDAIVRTQILSAGRARKATCDADRSFVVSGFPASSPGGAVRPARFMSIEDIQSLPIGQPTMTTGGFQVEGCALNLHFDPRLGGSALLVTRLGPDMWTVTTRPAPDNAAVCLDSQGDPKFVLALDFGATVFEPPP